MLFALYISCVGDEINRSKEGFKIGRIIISGLLFAGIHDSQPWSSYEFENFISQNCLILQQYLIFDILVDSVLVNFIIVNLLY